MRRFTILSSLVAVLVLSFAGLAGLASAHSFRTGDNITIGQSEILQQTLFTSGRNIDIDSEVFGDVFCAGQTVTVSGTVHGDVICAGQSVRVSGTVDGDVRLAGQTVTIGANIAGNATVAGQTFTLESAGKIDGDLTTGATDVVLNGIVGRDLAVGGSSVVIANKVGRDVKAATENLKLSEGAKVAGNVELTSKNELVRSAKSSVGGKVTRTEPAQKQTNKNWAIFGFSIGWFIYWFLAMLVTAMALALLFPRLLHNASNETVKKPWKALLVGLVTGIVLPVLLILLAITVVGIPLMFVLLLMWIVVVLLSGPFAGYYLGRLILRDSKQPLLIMLVGSSTLLVMYFIPFLGFIACLLAFWIGTGTILIEAVQRTPKPAYNLVAASKSKSSK